MQRSGLEGRHRLVVTGKAALGEGRTTGIVTHVIPSQHMHLEYRASGHPPTLTFAQAVGDQAGCGEHGKARQPAAFILLAGDHDAPAAYPLLQ